MNVKSSDHEVCLTLLMIIKSFCVTSINHKISLSPLVIIILVCTIMHKASPREAIKQDSDRYLCG